MKFLVVFSVCVAVAAAGVILPSPVANEAAEIQQILDAINHPSTDPATAAVLEQMLHDVLGIVPQPIAVGPAIIEDNEPISVGPVIVEEAAPTPVLPEAVVPSPESSPVVQIIINVTPGSNSPISVEGINPTPVIVAPSPLPEDDSSPIIVAPVPSPEIVPTPVVIAPEPVLVAPIIPAPVALPDTLN